MLITVAGVALDIWTVTGLLAVGMSLSPRRIIEPLRDFGLVIIALLGSFVLVPILAVVLTIIFPMDNEAKTALVILGVCAGGPFVIQLVRIARGNIPLAVGDMTLFLVIAILYIPLVLPLILYYAQVKALIIARGLIIYMLVPLLIGLIIKWRNPYFAGKWQPYFARLSLFSLFALLVAILLPGALRINVVFRTWLIPATIFLALGGMLIGYALAFRRPSHQQKVITFGTGQRNLAAAFLVADNGFSTNTFVMTIVAAILLTVIVHLIAAQWGRQPESSE